MKTMTKMPRSLLWLAAPVLLFAASIKAAPDTSETLDSLMAKRLAPDSTFVAMVEPAKELRLSGVIDTLPAPGKTTYMTETLAMRGVRPGSAVNHKMWLRSARGERVMAYVADEVAERTKGGSRVGADITLITLHLWNSRHGPGLLVTGVETPAAGVWPRAKAAVQGWFGAAPAELAR